MPLSLYLACRKSYISLLSPTALFQPLQLGRYGIQSFHLTPSEPCDIVSRGTFHLNQADYKLWAVNDEDWGAVSSTGRL